MKWKPLRPAGGMLASACGWMGAGYGRAPAAGGGGGTSDQIIAVEDNGGGLAEFTTGAAHGLAGSEVITITGTEIYDGEFTVASVPTPTSFTTNQPYAGTATGTWAAL